MKALLIGEDNFILSNIAERLYKEGYDVHIIGNMNYSDKDKDNPKKYKRYKFNAEDEKCEYIFLDNEFSVVVYIPKLQLEHNEIAQLSRILKYSNRYKVKNFIYLSSTDIYKRSYEKLLDEYEEIIPKSDMVMNMLSYEECCRLYNGKDDMTVTCFRVCDVYGPGLNLNQNRNGITGLIKKYNHVDEISEKDLSKFESVNDCIYIGDLVDAVYKSIGKRTSFILNISSNSLYSNEKAKRELGWNIKYDLRTGLEKVYLWKQDNLKNIRSDNNEKTKNRFLEYLKGIRKYLENIGLFILFALMSIYMNKNGMAAELDFSIVYIIIIAIMYGTNQSIISIILASILGIFLRIQNGESLIQIIYDSSTIFKISIYVFLGMMIGYVIDKKNDDIAEYEDKYKTSKDNFNFINNLYEETRIDKKELENQIINREDSLGKLFAITEKLNVLYPEMIFDNAVEAVADIMKSEDISIYILPKNQQYLRLISQSKNERLKIKKSINIGEFKEIRDKILSNEIFINKQMEKDIPTMMAPLIIENEVKGVICISNMKFEDVTLYKQNMLIVISRLTAGALSRAYTYEEAILNEKYIDDTEILRYNYFKKIIEEKDQSGVLESNILLKVVQGECDSLKKYIRSIDSIGIDSKENIYILLSNTNDEEIRIIMDRLENHNIKTIRESFEAILRDDNDMEGN